MQPRKIEIETVLNGWIVSVGCQRVVFDDKQKMLAAIGEYLDDAEATEEKFTKAVNYKYFRYQGRVSLSEMVARDMSRIFSTAGS